MADGPQSEVTALVGSDPRPEKPADRKIPWWMYIVGLSYALTLVLILYLVVWGPAELRGFVSSFSGEAMEIQSVYAADSPVAIGGLRAGDRVLSIDALRIRYVRDWTAATGNSQALRTQRWVVARGADQVNLDIVPAGATIRGKLAEGYIQYLSLLLPGLFLGFLIAWKRPNDAVGRIGAWFTATSGIAFGWPVGWAVPWRAVPAVLQWLLWAPQLSRFVIEGIFVSFFILFPRRLARGRWVWFLIWIPVLITLPWRAAAFNAVIHPGQPAPVPGWILQAAALRTFVYLVAGFLILAVSYRRFLDANEKRRVRVLLVGTAVSFMSAIVFVWLDNVSGRMSALSAALVIASFFSAFPIAMAYAILRHRVLDISVIVRQGLQYALARGGVIGVVPALVALLIIDLGVNSQQRLEDILRNRGWIYSGVLALSMVTYWKRKEWLSAIDRRFFRERYNAQQLLRDVVGEIRAAPDFEHAAARVVERIETALHPAFASVLVHQPDELGYRAVATFPPQQTPPHIAADSKLIGLVQVLGRPLEFLVGDSSWLDQRLPREESDFVRRARIDLLAPIAMGAGRTEALLALGIKRSEEPYTREDQELLETITASLALLLEKPSRSAARSVVVFQECPECGTCYDAPILTCAADSGQLLPMRFPRLLANRYRLDRRRGQGGMGTVYEATDSSLERRVAVKLIREDWVDSIDAVQRFRREARAAAGFSHPNVVTIYDYGVDAETRAFLVMQLLEGGTLRDELHRAGRLAPSRVVQIFRGVCAAVDAAHQRSLIHRDLKPENIFISTSAADRAGETIKVLDFGLAKFLPANDDSALTLLTAQTHSGVLIGTPAYMSPEQLVGERLDVRWDLWAMSVIAYEMLAGALPFSSAPGSEWRRAVLSGAFTPLTEHFNNPPQRWRAFFERSLAADRERRQASAAEFLGELERAFG